MDIIGDIVRHFTHIPIVMGIAILYGILLYYGFFKPIRKILDERREKQDKSASLALKARDESDRQFAVYETRLAEARKEGVKIRENMRGEVLEYQAKLLDEVKKDISAKKVIRQKEFDIVAEKAEKELKAKIPGLARIIAEKILKRSIAA